MAGRSAVVFSLAASPTGAASAVWDLGGQIALRESWTENTTFTAAPGNGDAISSLRLEGRALRAGRRVRFEASYEPNGQFYRDRRELNRVAHVGRTILAWEASPRSTLSFSESYSYTPDQGVSSTSFQAPLLFTRLGDRRSQIAVTSWRLQLNGTTDFIGEFRHQIQSYSEPSLADSAALSPSARIMRSVGPRAGIDAGAAYGWNRFESPVCEQVSGVTGRCLEFREEPHRSEIANLFTGGNRALGQRVTATARVGYNFVIPGNAGGGTRRGVQAQAGIQWTGPRVSAQGGYNRDVYTGSGALAVSTAQSVFLSAGAMLTRRFTVNAILNRSTSRSLGAARHQEVDSFNGQAGLQIRLRGGVSASAGYARYAQSSERPEVPDHLGFNRYWVALGAAFN